MFGLVRNLFFALGKTAALSAFLTSCGPRAYVVHVRNLKTGSHTVIHPIICKRLKQVSLYCDLYVSSAIERRGISRESSR